MIRDLEKKVYNVNKHFWHGRNFGELDHAAGREGVRLCCLAMFQAAPAIHHSDREYINGARRAEKKSREAAVLANYVRGEGCRKYIFPDCENCAMPKYKGVI